MANEQDSVIVKQILTLPIPARLNAFWEAKNKIKDDSTYWQILAAVWMGAEVCAPYRHLWIELFRSGRRNRHKLMKKGDRNIWRSLPSVVEVYRAMNPGESPDMAISWTLDRTVAERLAKGRDIQRRLINKEDIIAYFNRRREQEIIIIHEQERG